MTLAQVCAGKVGVGRSPASGGTATALSTAQTAWGPFAENMQADTRTHR